MRTRAPSRPRLVSCAICGTEFETRHSQGKYCSPECASEGERKSWREYGERNRPARQDYQRKHYEERRDEVLVRTRAYQKSPAGKHAARVNGERQRAKHPEKYRARQAVLVALRRGDLQRQPCARCGAAEAQAHHHDYDRPLDVTWLCEPCHRAEHRPHQAGPANVIHPANGENHAALL